MLTYLPHPLADHFQMGSNLSKLDMISLKGEVTGLTCQTVLAVEQDTFDPRIYSMKVYMYGTLMHEATIAY